MPTRIVLSLVLAVLTGGGFMAYDRMRGAEWVVSPQQIAEARAAGNAGDGSSPSTMPVLRSPGGFQHAQPVAVADFRQCNLVIAAIA